MNTCPERFPEPDLIRPSNMVVFVFLDEGIVGSVSGNGVGYHGS